MKHEWRAAAVAVAVVATTAPHSAIAQEHGALIAYRIAGDAVSEALGGLAGDAARGRNLVLDRTLGNCLICHKVPEPSERFMGELGPDLSGVGDRLNVGQLRLRLIDQSVLNPKTLMPPYYRVDNLTAVAERYRGKPVLDAQQIEDVVAYLASLRN